jgi:hypothetical protein
MHDPANTCVSESDTLVSVPNHPLWIDAAMAQPNLQGSGHRHPAPPRVDRAKVKAARKRGRKGRNR